MAGIETLIRLQQRELDTLRREQVKKEEERAQLIELATRLHQQLLHERELAAQDPVAMTQYMAGFEKRMQERQLAIAQEVILLDAALAKLADAIAERFSELKKYEITRDARLAAEKAKESQREQAAMDEVGIQRFSRNQRDE